MRARVIIDPALKKKKKKKIAYQHDVVRCNPNTNPPSDDQTQQHLELSVLSFLSMYYFLTKNRLHVGTKRTPAVAGEERGLRNVWREEGGGGAGVEEGTDRC